MQRVLFLQNDGQDGPGLLARVLAADGIELNILHPWIDDEVPANLDQWDGFAIGGGGMSVCELDQHSFLQDEINLVQAAREAGKPLLGLCLGAQIIAEALGGKVYPNQNREIGFQEVRLTPSAQTDSLWQDCPTILQPVHWHGDTFSLPKNATLLASSDLTENQMFRFGENIYGLQFHLEIDLCTFTEMLQADYGYLSEQGADPDRFLQDATHYLPLIEPTALTVFRRWSALLN